MSTLEMIFDWFAFAKKLREICISLLPASEIPMAASLEEAAELYATLLFCRTITNYKGTLILLEEGLIIESQTLQRSCFENSLWLRRLATEGVSFAKDINDDGYFNEANFAKILMSNSTDKETISFLQGHIRLGIGSKRINHKMSRAEGEKEDYAMFRHLSLSAAHPSVTSLLRHFVSDSESGTRVLSVETDASDREVMANLYFTVAAMMNCLDSFVHCLSIPGGEEVRSEAAMQLVVLEKKYDTAVFINEA